MKTFYLLSFSLLFLLLTIKAQTYDGSIILKTQAQVDAFNYTYVTGSLIIYDNGYPGEMTNLDGLSELDSVGGLRIGPFLYKLKNIEGLSGLITVAHDLEFDRTDLPAIESLVSLETVGGTLRINSNTFVESVSFPALKYVYELSVSGNNALKRISLPSLEKVTRDFAIANNNTLEDLTGLSDLHYIGDELVLYANPALMSTSSFMEINSIGFRLDIEYMNFKDLDGFNNLTSVNSLKIVNNNKLLNLDGLSKLTSIPGDFEIYRNPAMNDYDGVSNITYIGTYYLWDQNNSTWDVMSKLDSCRQLIISDNVSNIDGLSHLKVVGDISISSLLTNLDGLSGLRKVTGSINMGYNPLLANIDGLFNLDTIGAVVIYNNNVLDNLDGLSNLVYTGFLWIFSNPSLTNVDALKNLAAIKLNLQIDDNKLLENVNGFSGLISVKDLSINYNAALKDLNGFSGITSLNRLVIGHNSSLSNIDGLQNLWGDIDDLHFINNDALTDIGQLLPNIGNIKSLRIENNDLLGELGEPGSRVLSTLSIKNNDQLTNLNAFSNSLSINKIEITGNKNLMEYCGLYLALTGNIKPEVIINSNSINPSVDEIITGGPCTPSTRSFITVLSGRNEDPQIQTDASGGGMFVLNESGDTLSYWLRLCDVTAPITSAHFYNAQDGILKTIVFSGDSASGYWTWSDEQPFTEEILAEIVKGNIYINIHTEDYPADELRGTITFDKPVLLSAVINGSQVVPPNKIQGEAKANFYISGDAAKVEYNIFSSINMLNVSLNSAPAGYNGPVIRSIPVDAPDYISGVFGESGTDPLLPEKVADLLGCRVYVNLTTIYGEVRGQIKKEISEFPYMTFWAVNDARYGGQLFYFTLSEGYDFSNIEGNIEGIPSKDIEDLAIRDDGTIYIVNNIGTSRIYKIKPEQFDKDPSTPVQAVYVEDTKLRAGELPGEISSLHFIHDTLFGIGKGSKKIYSISTDDGSVTEISELNTDEFRTDGFTVGADSAVYLLKTVLYGPSEIWKFDDFPKGNISLVTSVEGSRKLESLSAHPNGNLYAADLRNLFEINLNKKTVSILDDHFSDIEGIDFHYKAELIKPEEPTRTFRLIGNLTDVSLNNMKPTEFNLEQNFPNPFNPSAIIRYSVPDAVYVKIHVYNSLGEIVKTLVNENKSPGHYQIDFEAAELSSGIYIYRIEAGNYFKTNKMILIK